METGAPVLAHLCGWLPDHPDRPSIAASLPRLIEAGPDLVADPNQSVLLYKCWSEVFSGEPDYPPQKIGDCTSFGWGHGNDLVETTEAYLGDLPIDAIGRTCTEALYAMGREAGNCLGWQDGCFGSALAKAATTMGFVRYAELTEADGGQVYSGQRAKSWGRTGAPDSIKTIAAAHKLGAAALVDTTDAGIAALQAGHPFAICTAQGFNLQRDADGFCKAHGRWGHCMLVAGYRSDRPGFLILQSWGPDMPTGPLVLGMPSWSFWCDVPTMSRILAERDSYALSGSPGFARRSLPAVLTRAA